MLSIRRKWIRSKGRLTSERRMRIRRRRFHTALRGRNRVLDSPGHRTGLSINNCNRISPIVREVSEIQHAVSAQLVHPSNIFTLSSRALKGPRMQPLNLVNNDSLPNFPLITKVPRRRRPRDVFGPLPCLPLHNRSGRTKMASKITWS